jgi:hypothetical protein
MSDTPAVSPGPPGLRLIRLLRGDGAGRLLVAPPQAEAERRGAGVSRCSRCRRCRCR